MFSPTLIWIRKPNRAFMFRSFSLFINWLCNSYSMKGSRLEMAVAFTSPWAFLFRRHSLKRISNNFRHWDRLCSGNMLRATFSYGKHQKYELENGRTSTLYWKVVVELYLAWIKHPFPVTAASDGRSIVVNSTSGTFGWQNAGCHYPFC